VERETISDKLLTRYSNKSPLKASLKQKVRAFSKSAVISMLTLVKKSQSWDKCFLRPLFCHNVFDDQVEDFWAIIRALKEIGTFVDSRTCLEMVEGKRRVDGKYFHLSFDDGHLNNFSNALPVLEREKVPAIFFVCSAHIGIDVEKPRARKSTWKRGMDRIPLASVDVLKDALAKGFEIGSHTVNHSRFSEISGSAHAMQEEIVQSRERLSEMLESSCDYIAWPYGRIEDADRRSLEVVRDAGYRGCFGAYRGAVIPGKTSRFAIPRHQFEPEWPLSWIFFFVKGNFEKEPPGYAIF
jgi:peptidoglycan/xylan/chitin deacetylase (PgdA/CDA1 family)